jgi:hypothetical protein
MNRTGYAAVAAAVLAASVTADEPPDFKPCDFPPSTATAALTITVGEKVTVGGPKSANFLPNEWTDVYVVPHRTWREGDPLKTDLVRRVRVKTDAKGGLPLTDLWAADKAGTFDIVVDYDGNGKFSYALDALSAFVVREKK